MNIQKDIKNIDGTINTLIITSNDNSYPLDSTKYACEHLLFFTELIKSSISLPITDCKLEELTREVRNHNNFAEKIPVLEEQIKALDKKIEKMS